MKSGKIQKLTVTALFTSLSVVLSALESFLPSFAILPPGAKPGFSNIIVMFSAMSLGVPQTLFIVCAKAFFAFLTRGAVAGLMSLAGGLLSGVCMLITLGKLKMTGCIGAGVLSAVCHNTGQLIVSFFTVGSSAVFGYAPVMLIASVATGVVTGAILRAALPYFKGLEKLFSKEMER